MSPRAFTAPSGTRIPLGAPQVSYVTDDLGDGLQFTELRMGDLTFPMASHPIWQLDLWDRASDTYAGALLPSDFRPGIRTYDGATHVWTWESDTGDLVRFRIDLNGNTSELALRAYARLSDARTVTQSIYALRVAISFDSASADRLMLPGYSPFVIAKPETYPDGFKVEYGGQSGPVMAVPPASTAGALPGTFQSCFAWRDLDRVGLRFRCSAEDRMVRGEFRPDGGSRSILEWITLPPNARDGAQEWDCPYDIRLAVVSGEWWDECRRLPELAALDGSPMRLGPLRRTMVDEPHQRIQVQLDMGVLHGPSNDWPRMIEEVSRVQQFLGTTDLLIWITNWHQHPQGHLWPEWSPTDPGFIEAANTIASMGAILCPYTYQIPVNPTTPSYLGSVPSWDGLTLKNRDGTFQEAPLPAAIDPVEGLARSFNWAHPEAVAAAIANWEEMPTQVPAASGAYVDTLPGIGAFEDYNPTLALEDRGSGSVGWHAGHRSMIEGMLAEWQSRRPGFWLMGEGFPSNAGDLFRILSVRVINPDSILFTQVPGATVAFGAWLRANTFGQPTMGRFSGAPLGLLFRWGVAANICQGVITTSPQRLSEDPDQFLIPQPGEPGYDERWPEESKPWEACRDWVVQGFDSLQPYYRGQLLRPLIGDPLRDAIGNLWQFQPGGGPLPNGPVVTSVWEHEDGTDLLVLLLNWTDDAATFDLQMSTKDYPQVAGRHFGSVWDPAADTIDTPYLFATDGSFGPIAIEVPAAGRVCIRIQPRGKHPGDLTPQPDPEEFPNGITDGLDNVLVDGTGKYIVWSEPNG